MTSPFTARHTLSAALAATLIGLAGIGHAETFSGNDVELVGSASILGNGDLQLTTGVEGLAGAAWGTTAWSTTENFYSTFTFSIAATDFDPMADGITFALQATGTDAIGTGGGGVGYEGLDAVGVIVQTWDNNRLGLVDGSDPFAAADASADLGAASLITGTQTITYDATTQTLSWTADLLLDGTPLSASDSMVIDLQARFGDTFYAGFTGGTGLSYADQRITSWSTSPVAVPEPQTYALFAAGLGLLGAMARRKQRNA